MKKLLLSAFLIGSSVAAFAQAGGMAISPIGGTYTDNLTFYATPAQICAPNGNVLGPNPVALRIHGGIRVAGSDWQNVVDAGPTGEATSITGFTDLGNGTWMKMINPSVYYTTQYASNTPFAGNASDVEGLNFVLNGGADGSNWDVEGKYDPGTGVCGDFYVPFPIGAPFGITAVKPSTESTFKLHAPYPNPFNGETSIRFELKKAGNVDVRIVNVLGQTVATLAKGFMTAGQKSLTWDAANAPAGIYFYTVAANGVSGSEKMQVIK